MSQLSLPSHNSYDTDNLSENGHDPSLLPKFPHTRAQLSAIARQHKPLDNYDSDVEGDDFNRVSPSLVRKVVALLDDEHEDELKVLLKKTYGMDDETVCKLSFAVSRDLLKHSNRLISSNRMS